jgi:release factor glutamine methyltransferase
MKNSKEIFRDLQKQILVHEDLAEIRSILFLVIESVLGVSQSDIAADRPVLLSETQQRKLKEIISRINAEEPVQYILGSSYFYGRKFNVNPAVLIPRSETEVLIEEVLKEVDPFSPGTILDIGTGSGCIAITLAKELPSKRVLAIDVSDRALKTAGENAQQLGANVEFHNVNALTENLPASQLEVIVSNPPYVTDSESHTMKKNVLDYEPHLALFVPDHDPFVFYSTIARKGFTALTDTGKVFVEINEHYGNEVADIFKDAGFLTVQIVKDLQGKNRIVSASKK